MRHPANKATLTLPKDSAKIGLAIGGGGARGAAAIGVLRIMEQAGIKPSFVAGTSAGAIVGALYCCGYTPDQLEHLYSSLSWLKLLKGNYLRKTIDELTDHCGDIDFDTLPIPFRCVATNLDDYSEQVLSHGSLADCIKASASMPILFSPVRMMNMRLADGGMINNLPTDVVRQMGADIIIAIDLQQITFWQTDFSLKRRLGIGGLMHWAVSHPEVKRYRQNVKLADIYIKPPLRIIDGYFFSNRNCQRMIETGATEALRVIRTD